MERLPRTRARGEAGQTMVFSVLMIAVLFAFAAVVVDSGLWFHTKRNLQGNADAAALAGGIELTKSTGQAKSAAQEFSEYENDEDGATVDSVEFSENNSRMKITVSRVQPGPFMSFFAFLSGEAGTAPTIRARATVELGQFAGGPGMLPIGFMRDSYTIGENTEAKFDDPGNGNRGLLEPDHVSGSNCTSSNPQDVYDMISGDGASCTYAVEDPPVTVSTLPGNKTGPTLDAFNLRISPTDTDSFEDIFEYDAESGRYLVKKPDSPRIGFVPVIQNTDDTTDWPEGKKEVEVISYLMVYIGDRNDPPTFRPTHDGKSTYLTPVDAIVPDSWGGDFVVNPWDKDFPDAPILVRLVE